ncbi:MAG: hypothetical protein HQ512_04665 [Rhodospirillales bacterium]|nr:hypothetical protein [Rhodospirillales bacterium]
MEWVIIIVAGAVVWLWFKMSTIKKINHAFVMDVVGESFKNPDGTPRQKIIAALSEGAAVDLVAEPDNAYDDKAVAVMTPGGQIGYLPAGRCVDVFNRLTRGEKVPAAVHEIRGGAQGQWHRGVWIAIGKADA